MSGENKSPKYIPLTCTGHSRPVTHLAFSTLFEDNSHLLISACKDGEPMLRDGVTGDWIGTFIGHKGATWSAKFSSDAKLSITASADYTAIVWDTFSGKALSTLGHNHVVRTASFAPAHSQAAYAVTAGNEKKIRIWDLSDSTAPVSEWDGADGTIKSSLWLNENIIITASDDKLVSWWDSRTPGKLIASIELEESIGQIEEHDGSLVIASGKKLLFVDALSHNIESKINLGYKASAATVNPLKTKFATGSVEDTWVRYHDLVSGDVTEILKSHHGPVHSISYSPDGQLCASGSEDGTIRLWKTESGPYGLWR
ncbi:WD40-repeat-containing domain protein [Lipomyces japonicus]|uniref:WD40-repeat-containing domain protein n=1 Tax=Lipomyces japonicus TaxID=56871 RepID=UPI0034CFD9EB